MKLEFTQKEKHMSPIAKPFGQVSGYMQTGWLYKYILENEIHITKKVTKDGVFYQYKSHYVDFPFGLKIDHQDVIDIHNDEKQKAIEEVMSTDIGKLLEVAEKNKKLFEALVPKVGFLDTVKDFAYDKFRYFANKELAKFLILNGWNFTTIEDARKLIQNK